MPLTADGPMGYIRTPVELDAAARSLDRTLLITPSPQKRFLHIVEFWRHIQSLPASWLPGYLMPLSPLFLELLRYPSLSNLPAPVWRDAYSFFRQIEKQNWASTGTAMDELHVLAAEHAIRSHAYVSALRELHQFLLDWEWIESPLAVEEWISVFGASTTAFGVYKAYVVVLKERSCAKLSVFTHILEQWVDYRQRTQAVAVVLLEADGDDRHTAGRVLLMDILSQEGVSGESNINNLLGDQGYETIEQLRRAQVLGEKLIAARFGKNPGHRRYHFSLHETSIALVGGSLGCAAAAGLTAGLTHHLNLPQRWTLPTTIACVGSLGEDGTIEPGGWALIEKKLRVAFCSPLEKIVIPASHREAALLFLQQLQREQPKRRLEVIGISHIRDLETLEGVFTIAYRRRIEQMRESLVRHGIPLLLLLTVILIGGGGYFAYRAYYDYPNLEQTMGLSVGASSIVYNPKDTLAWCFRDEKQVAENAIGFGDLEIGDGFTRHFWIWNMTPSDLKLRLSIEGPDAGDWYINMGDDNLTVPSAGKVLVTVMFAPLNAGAAKHAALVLRNPYSGDLLYDLHLIGAAGPPLAAGYALHLDGRDDQIHFGQRSTAFDITATATKEATFECWIRPTAPLNNAMILYNGQSRQNNPDIEDLFFGFVSPDTMYYRVGSAIGMVVLEGRQIPVTGQWLHLALAISIPQHRIAVYLNGQEVENRKADFLFDGPGTPFVTIGARNSGVASDLHFQGDIDEIRLWHSFRSRADIVRAMHRRLQGLTPDLAGYWDVDASVENTLFNANKQAHSGTLLHRPVLVRSDLALHSPTLDLRLVKREGKFLAVELRSGRYLVSVRPLLPRYSDATFAFWFLQEAEPAIHFNYVLKDGGWISVENNMLFTVAKKEAYTIPPGWHLGVCTVSADGAVAFYSDGTLVATSRSITAGKQDWHARFEGMMLGFRFDKEQQLASKYYDWYHPTLSHPRSYGSLHVWKRKLNQSEIAGLSAADRIPRSSLVASWPLVQLPDSNNNFIDVINHQLLHVKQVYGWE
ncbi:MAG: LamG domain-containing protein [Bacteroidetes bacterium]|nr:LamG domain-containing protein [Bacteroidota bacterium]